MTGNGTQNWIAAKIDRAREAGPTKAARTARAMFLRMEARKTITAMLAEIEEPAERAAILKDVLDMVAENLHPLTGRVEAATAFNSRATDICATFKLGGAIKRAAAEHAFARMSAANDGGDQS
tara:strand:+ start:1536 stop:1904 length:369 start_codon:yes stop_codon:yes gene_type:complete